MRNRLTLGLVFCVLCITTTIYAQVQDNWANTKGSMAWAVEQNQQVLLKSGKVLVAGGTTDGTNYLATAQLYDPSTGLWTATGSMQAPQGRGYFAAVVLHNGSVLVEGGFDSGGPLASAELYDPTHGTWSSVSPMPLARYGHTATLLQDGKVMVTGGCIASGCSAVTGQTEIYDPTLNTWTTTKNPLNQPRAFHTATLLGNSKVLVVGGCTAIYCSGITAGSEIFNTNNNNLAASTWSSGPSSSVARYLHTATLLSNGKVLVAGGEGYTASVLADLYDPTVPPAGSFSPTTSLNKPGRFAHTATALPNHTVLLAAGEVLQACYRSQCAYPLSTAEIYDYNVSPPTVSPTAGVLNTARGFHSATLLASNDVLVAGGCTGGRYCPKVTAASEIYTPLTLSISSYSLNFGLEQTGVPSPAQPVTVKNVSQGPVTFAGIAPTGDYAESNNCPTKGMTLASGNQCTINVTFKPKVTGTRTGAVTLHDNSVGSPTQIIALTGTGEQYAITFTPNPLTLPSVLPNNSSTASATVTNDGVGPVNITSMSVTPADGVFRVTSSNCPSTLAVQQTCTVTITFTPPDSISYTETLQVFDNAPFSPHLLTLTGTGID